MRREYSRLAGTTGYRMSVLVIAGLQLIGVEEVRGGDLHEGVFDIFTQKLGLTSCQEVQLLTELLVEHATRVLPEDPLERLE